VSDYGYDGFGTVRQLTNAAGAVTDTYEYDAFGNEINHTGATPNNYLYRGEQYDSDLGLYYLRARYYNPATGRFVGRDPAEGDQFDPASLHKYLYAQGDPVNWVDPTGRDDLEEYNFIESRETPAEGDVEGELQEAKQELCATNPVHGRPRVGSGLKKDPYHAFPDIVDNYAVDAVETLLQSGAVLYQVLGSLNGAEGRFEWIVQNNEVTHRFFCRGGGLNGAPIVP